MNELIFLSLSAVESADGAATLCVASLCRNISAIPIFEVFWSEEEEKTIEYRFFNDVTKTRSMPSRVYAQRRGDSRRLCFRKIEPFFQKRFCKISPINMNFQSRSDGKSADRKTTLCVAPFCAILSHTNFKSFSGGRRGPFYKKAPCITHRQDMLFVVPFYKSFSEQQFNFRCFHENNVKYT